MKNSSPNLTRGQLRLISDSEEASPQARINAAKSLLQLYGASDRNLRVARRIAKRFLKFIGDTETGQRRIRWAAEQLAARIERISEGETGQSDEANENEADLAPAENDPPTTIQNPTIGGLDLLPGDEESNQWDKLVGAYSRGELFRLAWGLNRHATRSEIIAAVSDPAKLETHTRRIQLWAISRDQADAKFATDGELVRAALAERGLPDSDEGREELLRQILASGEPLYQFETPTLSDDADATGLPVLRRSKAGVLVDAINFIESWPLVRPKHQPL